MYDLGDLLLQFASKANENDSPDENDSDAATNDSTDHSQGPVTIFIKTNHIAVNQSVVPTVYSREVIASDNIVDVKCSITHDSVGDDELSSVVRFKEIDNIDEMKPSILIIGNKRRRNNDNDVDFNITDDLNEFDQSAESTEEGEMIKTEEETYEIIDQSSSSLKYDEHDDGCLGLNITDDGNF